MIDIKFIDCYHETFIKLTFSMLPGLSALSISIFFTSVHFQLTLCASYMCHYLGAHSINPRRLYKGFILRWCFHGIKTPVS